MLQQLQPGETPVAKDDSLGPGVTDPCLVLADLCKPGVALVFGHLKETKPNPLTGLGDVFMPTSTVGHFETHSDGLPKGGL